MTITLRPATLDDAPRLLDWRNDPETRAASRTTGTVTIEEHRSWLSALLANPNRRLFVAELDGEPVGTVRLDLLNGHTELSWTVAPAHRKRGIGRTMVRLAAEQAPGPLTAEIKTWNVASLKIAESAGFREASRDGDLIVLARPVAG